MQEVFQANERERKRRGKKIKENRFIKSRHLASTCVCVVCLSVYVKNPISTGCLFIIVVINHLASSYKVCSCPCFREGMKINATAAFLFKQISWICVHFAVAPETISSPEMCTHWQCNKVMCGCFYVIWSPDPFALFFLHTFKNYGK